MNLLRTLIIDDEADARDLMKLYCAEHQDKLVVVGEAASVQEAISAVNICKPDLVFLDIHLKDGTGFDILDALPKHDFHLIFTTAHDEFALKAFQYSAFQYLLKPIDNHEFSTTLDRLGNLQKLSSEQVRNGFGHFASGKAERIILNAGKTQIAVLLSEICTIHAESNFSTVKLQNGDSHLVSMSLKEFEQMLSNELFCRCHHSHIVNLQKIKSIESKDGGFILHTTNDEALPVSRRKRKELQVRFNSLS